MLHLDYTDLGMFESGYMILNYRFRNAIYYRFGKHITLEQNIKIFDSINFEKEFELTVFGFFEKKKYHLKFEPKLKLITRDFKAEISNLKNNFKFKTIPYLCALNFKVELVEIEIKSKKLKIMHNKILYKQVKFNQNDFI